MADQHFATMGQCCGCRTLDYQLFPDLYVPVETVSFVTERTVTETRTLVEIIHRADSDGEETVVATPSDTTVPDEETTDRTDTVKAAGHWVWEYPTGEPEVVDGEESPAAGGVTFQRTTTETTITVHEERRLALRFDLSTQLAFGETIPGGDPTIVSAHLRIATAEFRRSGFPSGEEYSQTVQASAFGLAIGDVMPEDADEFDTLAADPSLDESLVEHEDETIQYVDITTWLPSAAATDGVILFDETGDDSGIAITSIKLAIARAENPGAGDWHSGSDLTYDWKADWIWVEDGKVRYKTALRYDNQIILGSILPEEFFQSTADTYTIKLIDPADDSVVVSQTFTTTLVDTGETEDVGGFIYPVWTFSVVSTGSWGSLVHFEEKRYGGTYVPWDAPNAGFSFRESVIELIAGSFRDEGGIRMGYSQVPLWQETPPPSSVIAQIEFTADNQRFRTAAFTALLNGNRNASCPSHCVTIPPHTVLQWNVDELTIFGEEVNAWDEANHSHCLFEIHAPMVPGNTGEAVSIAGGEYVVTNEYLNESIARRPSGSHVFTKGAMQQHGLLSGVQCDGSTVILRGTVEDAAAGDEGWVKLNTAGTTNFPRFQADSPRGPGSPGTVNYTLYIPSTRLPPESFPHDDSVSYGVPGETITLSEGFSFAYTSLEFDDASLRVIGEVDMSIQPKQLSFWATASLGDPSTFNDNALDLVADGALFNGSIGSGLVFELNTEKTAWVLIGQQTEGTHAETFSPEDLAEIDALLELGDAGAKWYFKDSNGDHFSIDDSGTVESVLPTEFVPTRFGGVIEVELDFEYLQSESFGDGDAVDENGYVQEYLDCSLGLWDFAADAVSEDLEGLPEGITAPTWLMPDSIEDHRNSGFAGDVWDLPLSRVDVVENDCPGGSASPVYHTLETTVLNTVTTEPFPFYTSFAKVSETITVPSTDGDYTVEQTRGVGTGVFNVMAGIDSSVVSIDGTITSGDAIFRTKAVDVSVRFRQKVSAAIWDSLRAPDLAAFTFGAGDMVGADRDVFVLDGFTVTSDSTSTFTPPVAPNPIEKTVNEYTFDDYYANGSIGSHSSNTTIEVCAQHRVDRLSNIALAISGRLAEA